MPVVTCSRGNLQDYIPSDLVRVDVSCLSTKINVAKTYVQAKIKAKYMLSTYRRPSIKLVIESDSGTSIDLHIFGPVATQVDSCSVGDTLVLKDFEVDVVPRSNKRSGPYNIILDDDKPQEAVILVVKASPSDTDSDTGDGSNSSLTPVAPSTPTRSTPSSPRPGSSHSPDLPTTPTISSASQSQTSTRDDSNSSSAPATPTPTRPTPTSPRPGTSRSPGPTTPNANSKETVYSYVSLNDVTAGTRANVYGVVTTIKSALKTCGSDYYMGIEIVDPSLPGMEKLTCSFFNKEEKYLPARAAVGDVVRVHRFKIQTFQGRIQARTGPGCHWVLFRGCYDTRMASSDNYTLKAEDKNKVCELFKWWEDKQTPDSVDPDLLDIQLTPMVAPPQTFKTLEELKHVPELSPVNVYAVVLFCRPLARTIRSEYHLLLNITDQSLRDRDAKITCNLFHVDTSRLPFQAQQGNVIRIHDMTITTYRGQRQGRNGDHFRWVLFQDSFDNRTASHRDYDVKDDERTKVESMLEWWRDGPESIPFCQVSNRQYFNLICQVILNVLPEEGKEDFRLLKVWDGTRFDGRISELEVSASDGDQMLVKVAGDLNLIHNIRVFDNHCQSVKDIKPWDFIKLTNLHAAVVNHQVEMTLHAGEAYQRGVAILEPDHRAVVKLKADLDALIAQHSAANGGADAGGGGNSGTAGDVKSGKNDDNHASSSNNDASATTTSTISSHDSSVSGADSNQNASSIKSSSSSSSAVKTMISPPTSTSVVCSMSTRNTLPECDRLTLQTSITSPPSSMELSQKDRFIVQAILAKDKAGSDVVAHHHKTTTVDRECDRTAGANETAADKSEKAAAGKATKVVGGECDMRDGKDVATMSEISVLSSQAMELSLTGSTPMDQSHSTAEEQGSSHASEMAASSGTTRSSPTNQSHSTTEKQGSSWLSEVTAASSGTGSSSSIEQLSSKGKPSHSLVDDEVSFKNGNSQEVSEDRGGNPAAKGGNDDHRVLSARTTNNVQKSPLLFSLPSLEKTFSPGNPSEIGSSQESFQTAMEVSPARSTFLRTPRTHPPSPATRNRMHPELVANSPTEDWGLRRSSRMRTTGAETQSAKKNEEVDPSEVLGKKRTTIASGIETRKRKRQKVEGGNRQGNDGSSVVKQRHQSFDSSSSGTDEGKENERMGRSSESKSEASTTISSGLDIVDDLTSSQDSYHTADHSASPVASKRLKVMSHHQSSAAVRPSLPSTSTSTSSQTPYDDSDWHISHPVSEQQQRHLTLRARRKKNSVVPRKNSSSPSQTGAKEKERLASTSASSSGDHAVSSSVTHSHHPTRNDEGQQIEIHAQGVTSSSTGHALSTNTDHHREKRAVYTRRRRKLVTTSVSSMENRGGQYFKLDTFVQCRRAIKLKVLARLSQYAPCTGNISSIVHMCCPKCKNMISTAEIRCKKVSRCPNRCGNLEAHMVLNLWLTDGESEVKAVLWGEQAVTFFQGVTPTDLLHKSWAKEKVQRCLHKLCPPETEIRHKPWMECSLFSYLAGASNTLCFQIFDTVVL